MAEFEGVEYDDSDDYLIAVNLRHTFFRDYKTRATLAWLLGSVRTFETEPPADMAEAVLRQWGARLLGVMGVTQNLEGLVDVLATMPDPVLMNQEEDTT